MIGQFPLILTSHWLNFNLGVNTAQDFNPCIGILRLLTIDHCCSWSFLVQKILSCTLVVSFSSETNQRNVTLLSLKDIHTYVNLSWWISQMFHYFSLNLLSIWKFNVWCILYEVSHLQTPLTLTVSYDI